MADDRIFIRCDTCGAWKMLMKHIVGALETRPNGILDWLDNHGQCHPRVLHADLGGIVGFSLHTEEALRDGTTLRPEKQNAEPPKEEADEPTADEPQDDPDCPTFEQAVEILILKARNASDYLDALPVKEHEKTDAEVMAKELREAADYVAEFDGGLDNG